MSAAFLLPKGPEGLMNFSVVNDEGITLSFAADDSCGTSPAYYVRTYLARFDDDGRDLQEQVYSVTPEQYLEALAKHLGYTLVAPIQYTSDPNTLRDAAIPYLRAGEYIGAIKQVRYLSRWGLKVAKDLVDSIKDQYLPDWKKEEMRKPRQW